MLLSLLPVLRCSSFDWETKRPTTSPIAIVMDAHWTPKGSALPFLPFLPKVGFTGLVDTSFGRFGKFGKEFWKRQIRQKRQGVLESMEGLEREKQNPGQWRDAV